jgi:predicted RNA-binding Zn-ribbon protein involved in translation (DUF1610 family)
LKSIQTTAATGARTKVLAAKDVRTLIANNLRSLICRCLATQQPVDLQVYADCATLARIGSDSVRFQCPHCGEEHETKLAAACPEILWLESHQATRTRHQHARW